MDFHHFIYSYCAYFNALYSDSHFSCYALIDKQGVKMSGYNRNEKTNNILFAFFFVIFLILLFCLHYRIFTSTAEIFLLLLLFFGGLIYGYISKNPIKSFLLIFSFWFLFFLYLLFGQITQTSVSIFTVSFLKQLVSLFLYPTVWGITGFLMAKESSNKTKRIIYIILAILICFTLGFIFMIGLGA